MTDSMDKAVENTSPDISISQVSEAGEVSGLSDRDIKWRAKYKLTQSELQTLKEQKDREIKEVSNKADSALKQKTQVEGRWMEAELKAEAIAAGIKDLDLIKLIDTGNLKVSEDGTIHGLKEAVADFKSKKPTFFGDEKKISSSTNAPTPTNVSPARKNAYDLSKDEWEKNKHKYMNGRF